MRILFFLESLHGGGKERRAAELIGFLKEQPGDFEIELVLTEEDIYYEDVRRSDIKITVLKRKVTKYDPGVFFRFYFTCRRFKPDIIHTWGKMATFYAIPAKLLCGVPLVANLIADTIKGYGRFSKYSYLLKTNMFFSDIVLANSQAGLNIYDIVSPKSRVIYNGVRLSRFRGNFDIEGVRKEFGITTRFTVIMVATFSEFKDYDLFLDTAREAAKKRSDVTFMAAGDGPQLSHIRSRIEMEAINNVVLAGRQKNVERLISASDIGLLCTKSEGISNSIIEYMALGKPVIVSDIKGGSKELIADGITGYCTPRDPRLIYAIIENLLNDEDLRISMGAKGKKRIESEFSIERMGEEFISLYHEVLAVGNHLIEKKAI